MNSHTPTSNASEPLPDDDREALRNTIAALTAELLEERGRFQELHDRQAALESTLAYAPFGIALAPLGGALVQANERFCAIVGYSLPELRSMHVREITHPDDLPHEMALIGELLAGKHDHYVIEKRYIRKDGSVVPVRLVGLLARDAQGRPVQGVAIVEDISEQVDMTAALRRSEARYRSLVEDQLDMILRWRADGLRVYVNDACCRFFGRTREELLGAPIGQFAYAPDFGAVRAALAQLRPEAPDTMVQNRALRADGRIVWTEWNVKGIFAADGTLVETQAVGRDISARREAEATRDALVAVLEASPDWVVYLDATLQIHYLNRTARQMHHVPLAPDYRTIPLRELLPPASWHILTAEAIPTAHQSGTWQGEVIVSTAERHEFPALLTVLALRDSTGIVDRLALIAHDLSEQKRIAAERLALERRLLDAQKLESLGILAGGIAHDFNNILTAIMGHTDLALADPLLSAETRRSLEIVMTGVQRAAELTGAILAYAGKGRLSLGPVDLNAMVRELTDLLIVSALRHCTVQHQLAPDLPAIYADQAQIRQVLLNLLVNAAEAIDTAGGTIEVWTTVRELDRDALASLPFNERLAPGRYVEIVLIDTGGGIDPAMLSRIFDPFFTTKFTGRGMGLAAVQGIVRTHQGSLRVQSTPGRGTRFEIWLPAFSDVAPPEPPPPVHLTPLSGQVLVIDDEADVLAVTARMLRVLGFRVLTATNGPEGLALLNAGVPELRCSLIDLTMPDMRGDAVAAAMRTLHPDLPLILMSGYSPEEHRPTSEQYTFVQKPFSLSELRAVIEAVLG
jgi:two-component system, cell cycle sensor histidine kinase and response regulator CckA